MQFMIVLVVRIVRTLGTISMKEEIHKAEKNDQKHNRKGSLRWFPSTRSVAAKTMVENKKKNAHALVG